MATASFDTDLCPDAVEFCPYEGAGELLVCANYQLVDGASQTKHGRLLVLHGPTLLAGGEAPVRQTIATGAVFDVKWAPAHVRCLGEVNADGALVLYSLSQDGAALERLASAQLAPESAASAGDDDVAAAASGAMSALSLDWGSRLASGGGAVSVCVSFNTGELALWRADAPAGLAEPAARWHAHEFEAWVCAFDPHAADGATVVLSGGDDSLMRVWDLRASLSRAAHTLRQHGAGVCALAPSPHVEHVLLSGSLDEAVRVWDARVLGRGPLSQTALGGGVWRLAWHAGRADCVAAACMTGGSFVLRADAARASECVVAHHQAWDGALTYGIGWSHALAAPAGQALLATCSFYDKRVRLWCVDLDGDGGGGVP